MNRRQAGISRSSLVLALFAGVVSAQDTDPKLAELVKAVRRAEGVADANAALDAVAALGRESGHDAAAVTGALFAGLERQEVDVRVHAIQLLRAAPDRGRALACLIEGSRQHHARWAKMRADYMPPKGDGKGAPTFESDPKAFFEHVEKVKKNMETLLEKMKVVEAEKPVANAYFDALVEHAGEEAVAGLAPLLRIYGIGDDGKRVVAALFDGRGEAGLRAAVDYLEVPEDAIDEFTKAEKKAKRTKARRPPRNWKGSKDQWAGRERQRIGKLLGNARERVAKVVATRDLYVSWLREQAEANGLPKAPDGERRSAWRAWAARAAKAQANK